MFREGKNIKDTQQDLTTNLGITIKDSALVISYTKTNKLITALYMVTDIIDKDEPLRNKLRTLGVEIISDMNSIPSNVCSKISEIMSFLDIASAVNIISEMNYSILKKEFLELNQSIKESTDKVKTISKQINLSEFFREEISAAPYLDMASQGQSIGHPIHTRIGVQKGSTLMQALSDKLNREARPNALGLASRPASHTQDSNMLKKQRRNDIINIIKTIDGSVTIKDIKDKVQGLPAGAGSLLSCSEKTLQRELVSMVKDNVLKKVGEKRWSKYFLK